MCEFEKTTPIIARKPIADEVLTFTDNVSPILENNNCKGCHATPNGLDFTAENSEQTILSKNTINS